MLRYKEQAKVLLELYGDESKSIHDLVKHEDFKNLNIYESGISGPFRKYFKSLPNYQSSFYWNDLKPGDKKEGIINQDLMKLTFENDQFDLIITSDIFEHIRKPFKAFKEIHRVLKLGGVHVFTIPLYFHMPRITRFRVDTSTTEDMYILPAHYHGDGARGKSLVYTDFGTDIINHLNNIGFHPFFNFAKSSDPNVCKNIPLKIILLNLEETKLMLLNLLTLTLCHLKFDPPCIPMNRQLKLCDFSVIF